MSDDKESIVMVSEEDFAKDRVKWLRMASSMCRVMVGNEQDGYSLVAGGSLTEGMIDLRDPRDAEIATLRAQLETSRELTDSHRAAGMRLRAQLADADSVISTSMRLVAFVLHPDTKAETYSKLIAEVVRDAIAAYDVKHKEPAK